MMIQPAALILCTVYSLNLDFVQFHSLMDPLQQLNLFAFCFQKDKNTISAGSPLFYTAAPYGTCAQCCRIDPKKDIQFQLYTRENLSKPENIYLSDTSRLLKSNFNKKNPLVIYFHGFSEAASGENQSSQRLKDAFLKTGNYNVILVDWSPLSALPWYVNAVENIPIIARYSARLIRFLIKNGLSIKRIHLLGFSLGAEICGFIGQQLLEWGYMLPRITGLDPPLPMFENNSTFRYLGSKVAKFVDVIHTDGGILGNPKAMGHADFYPNGGKPLQPGCVRTEFSNNRWVSGLIGCSHQRAWEYFEESLLNKFSFPATMCKPRKSLGICNNSNGKAYMGMGASKNLRGKFYLETNNSSPYGKNFTAALVLLKQIPKQFEISFVLDSLSSNRVSRESISKTETKIPLFYKTVLNSMER